LYVVREAGPVSTWDDVLRDPLEIFLFQMEVAGTGFGVAIDRDNYEKSRGVPAEVKSKACPTDGVFFVEGKVGYRVHAGMGVPADGFGFLIGGLHIELHRLFGRDSSATCVVKV
jgi:hypothetical protein